MSPSNNVTLTNQHLIEDAIQLVSATQKVNHAIQYNINQEALDIISAFMDNGPIEIISSIGQARKGKSYTLTKIVQQMSDSSVVPFKSSDYNEPYTRGIWMYLLLKCSDHSNTAINSIGEAIKTFPCSNDNKQYIILDIEGSYTDKDDQVMRYSTIVTLISSQTFLFLHQKLYKHDIDQIRYIQTFIHQMNAENIAFDMNDVNLGAILREPFKSERNSTEETVNDDLSRYNRFFEGLNKFATVQTITHFNDKNYKQSIQNVIEYISHNAGKQSRMKFISNANKLSVLLTEIIEQFNNNPELSRVCIFCVFKRVVEWLPYGEFGRCSKKCDGGIQVRNRGCNTGKIDDCKQYVGGSDIDEQECNTFECKWLPWNEWSECTRLCKGGKQFRSRECSTGDIDDCIDMFGGNKIEEQRCNEQKCKWIEKSITACNAGCGSGEQKIIRTCENGNDRDCAGENYRMQSCYNWVGCIKYAVMLIVTVTICIAVVVWWCKKNYETVLHVVCVIIVIAMGLGVVMVWFGDDTTGTDLTL